MAATDTNKVLEIKIIHIARGALGLADDTYRELLRKHGNGATSSKDLTASQRLALLNHFKACGFKLRTKAGKTGSGWRREPQQRKLRALWYALAEAEAVTKPANGQACDTAIEAWALRQLSTDTTPLQALRFASGAQMAKLIEELKAWGLRVGADVR